MRWIGSRHDVPVVIFWAGGFVSESSGPVQAGGREGGLDTYALESQSGLSTVGVTACLRCHHKELFRLLRDKALCPPRVRYFVFPTGFGLHRIPPQLAFPPQPLSVSDRKDAGSFTANALLRMAEAARMLDDPDWALELHSAASAGGLVSRHMCQVVVRVLAKAGRLEAAAHVLQV